MVTDAVSRSIPPAADAAERSEKAAAAAKERPRWKSAYKGPDPNRQKIDGKAVVSREELEDFKRKHGPHLTLRDLLNADATGKLPPPVATSSGRGTAEGRKAEDDVVYKPRKLSEQEMRAHMAEMSRPGRDAIEPTLGPETGLAALGRAGAGALVRGLAGMAGRRTATKEVPERTEPPSLYPEPPKTGGVFSSARRGTRGEQQAAGRKASEDYARDVMERGAEMGMKRGGNVKSYAKGGSVRGAGCESRTKKTRYV
jgi:hypothetical protein